MNSGGSGGGGAGAISKMAATAVAKDGISFLVRVHNEEEALEDNVRNLLMMLTISYEVLLLLNLCTGTCREVVARLVKMGAGRVKTFEYNYALSRPGYELLATDSDSVHSPVAFLNWGLEKATYKWIAKWDADFLMTPALAWKMNTKGREGFWGEGERVVRLEARGLDGAVEAGDYLSSCVDHFRKDVFWETAAFRFRAGALQREVWDDVFIQHVSHVARLKPYWFETGWYGGGGGGGEDGGSDEAAVVRGRLLALERDFGMLPLGTGRSGATQEAVAVAQRILAARPAYVEVQGGLGLRGGR